MRSPATIVTRGQSRPNPWVWRIRQLQQFLASYVPPSQAPPPAQQAAAAAAAVTNTGVAPTPGVPAREVYSFSPVARPSGQAAAAAALPPGAIAAAPPAEEEEEVVSPEQAAVRGERRVARSCCCHACCLCSGVLGSSCWQADVPHLVLCSPSLSAQASASLSPAASPCLGRHRTPMAWALQQRPGQRVQQRLKRRRQQQPRQSPLLLHSAGRPGQQRLHLPLGSRWSRRSSSSERQHFRMTAMS